MEYWKVIFKRSDGSEEWFGEFNSESWAHYHIALAKSTSGQKGYRDYSDGEFIITKETL